VNEVNAPGAHPALDDALNQIQVFLRSGRPADAAALCRRVLESTQHPGAFGFLAMALVDQGQLEDAIANAKAALRLDPQCCPAHTALGFVEYSRRRPEDALPHFKETCTIRPDSVPAHYHLALCYSMLGDNERALAHCETVLYLTPDHARAHFSRAVLWLASGKDELGWLEFEWRWRTGTVARPNIPRPQWDGSDPVGKTILVHTEQGVGDTIQFVRLLPLLKKRGARVVFACQKASQAVLSRCAGIDEWMPIDQPAAITFDLCIPLGSLPNRLGIDSHNVPRHVPYVFPDPARVEHWRNVLRPLSGYKVGICWQGSPTYSEDYLRSLPLRHFAPLAEIPSVRLISLQKGFGEEQIEANRDRVPVTVLDGLDEAGRAFVDTAAVMQHLDLVVTCNSAVAHLAGALGVPTWVALSTGADWRWPRGRSDSPWYPTLRLFRQKKYGDWDGVFAEMQEALRQRTKMPGAEAIAPPPLATAIHAAIAPGELFDKLTILEIKAERIKAGTKLDHVLYELGGLRAARDAAIGRTAELDALVAELRSVNEALWEIEDAIRTCESRQDFGPRFVELARSVYCTNDRRAAVKRRINELLGSAITEEKSYPPY
jgi:Tetratricopeptide repeat